jgi:site-specific recombinase XerD
MQTDLAYYLQPFFETYLARQRGLSPNTLKSYRDTFKLLIAYLQRRYPKAWPLRITQLDAKTVLDFLEYLEDTEAGRGNSAHTRNARRAAIRCFFEYVAMHHPALERQAERVLTIPKKRANKKQAATLDRQELEAMLAQPNTDTPDGIRDLALLAFLYNVGARATEAAQIRLSGFDFPNRLVTIRGKGDKERITPLWPSTVKLLEVYAKDYRRKPKTGFSDCFFINQRGRSFTRFGIRNVVKKYVRLAAKKCPSLAAKKLAAHSMRHTCASHLLEARVESRAISGWLGHALMSSTDTYLHTNLNFKRQILEKFGPPDYVASVLTPKGGDSPDKLLDWLKNL